MTENELRKKVADTMSAWVGGERGGEQHREILQLYNGRKVLPRGYALNSGDAYCAAAVSAAWIKAGCDKRDITPIECSCSKMLDMAKVGGYWVELDSFYPHVGDVVFYDWQDSGNGDNTGAPDHAGIVVRINDSGYMTIAEGNMDGGKIGLRELNVNGLYIRGYITPDYATLAELLTEEAEDEAQLIENKANDLTGLADMLRYDTARLIEEMEAIRGEVAKLREDLVARNDAEADNLEEVAKTILQEAARLRGAV